MKKYTLTLCKNGHDPFIDFLKGVCIILVIITHCLSGSESKLLFQLWGRTAVPIFFIIQVFHIYKHGFDYKVPNAIKIWKRIVRPFLLVQILIAALLLSFHPSLTLYEYINHILKMGGYGPGEDYPWVYVQFALLLPIIAPLFRKMKPIVLLCIFIGISHFFEAIACISNISDWPNYSLCFVRYTFLIYLGYILAKYGFVVNVWTIGFSLISLIATYYLTFSNLNYEPFFFIRTQWKYCHWICYIYIAYIVIPLLKVFYEHIFKYGKISNIVKLLGKDSYEIYLFQMIYFVSLSGVVYRININMTRNYLLYIIISICICVLIPLLYMYFRKKIVNIRHF